MSQVALTKKYKNVLITRTLSKAYGLAGMRFGYAMADKEVIDQISGSLLPWNVGTIPMWAALAAFEDTEGLAERVKFNNDAVDFITESLSEIPGFVIFPPRPTTFSLIAAKPAKQARKLLRLPKPKASSSRRDREIRQRWLVPCHHRHCRRKPYVRGCHARVLWCVEIN